MFELSGRAVLVCAGVLVLQACHSGDRADATPGQLSAADLAGIRAADSSFMTAANAGDADAVAAVYTGDATLLPPNLPPQRGRNAIKGYWNGLLQAYTVKFEIGSDTVEGRGDLAYNVGHYRLTAVPKDKANPGMADEGKFVEILKKQGDGTWKYVVDMYSSNLAGPR